MKQHRRGKRTRGMAMVEMIFVLPVLLLLVFAIAEFGLMFSRWLTLSNAVREGARAGVAWRGPTTPCPETAIENDVQTTAGRYARAGGVPIDDTAFTVTGVCDGPGTPLEVTATYDFPLHIPYGNLGTIPIGYKSSMRNEF